MVEQITTEADESTSLNQVINAEALSNSNDII